MKSDFLNIVLYEPEIPQNTGNIARLCACLGAKLYLVGRLGFTLSDRYLKRAGLDYWDKLDITQIKSDVQILQLATRETQDYRKARETREAEQLKAYEVERKGTIESLKVLMQDRLLVNAETCLKKGYYTANERETFHNMYELYIGEPFGDGNKAIVALQPKMEALPWTKEEADKLKKS